MTEILNRTRHAVASVVGRDARGAPALFLSVKASFVWDRKGGVHPAEPVTLVVNDEHVEGKGAVFSLLCAAEVGPRKPKVDVLLAGALEFGGAVEEIDATLAVGRRLVKTARIFGPRHWIPGVAAELVASRPRLVTRVPIEWSRSFGGADPEDPSYWEPRNPAGRGMAKTPKALRGTELPSFENPAEPIVGWKTRPAPHGFGPIPAHWQPRSGLAGTYDQRWRDERAPLLPADFSESFFNVASVDQQLDRYLEGEPVQLLSMTPAGTEHFQLPRFAEPVLFATNHAFVESRAVVDTVIIEPEHRRFSLVGRAGCPLEANDSQVHEIVVGKTTLAHRRALERGKRYIRRRVRPAQGAAE